MFLTGAARPLRSAERDGHASSHKFLKILAPVFAGPRVVRAKAAHESARRSGGRKDRSEKQEGE